MPSAGDRYLRPRPPPAPRLSRLSTSPSCLQTAGQRQRTPSPRPGRDHTPCSSKSANNSPLLSPSLTFGRFLHFNRKSAFENECSGATSPTGLATSIRGAVTQLKTPPTASPVSESERGRKGYFPWRRSDEKEAQMDIGDPVLISRTDEGRHCIPLSRAASSSSFGDDSSRQSKELKCSMPSRDPHGRRARDPSPLGLNPPNVLSGPYPPGSEPQEPFNEVFGLAKAAVQLREPSPLRDPIEHEENPVKEAVFVSDQVIQEAEDEEDDFNFHSQASTEQVSELGVATELSAPPSRSRIAAQAKTTADENVEISPTKAAGQRDRASQVPTPLDLLPAGDVEQTASSRFSIYSTTTAAFTPTTNYSASLTSPSLSPGRRSSYTLPSPNRLSADFSLPSISDYSEEGLATYSMRLSIDPETSVRSSLSHLEDFSCDTFQGDQPLSKRNGAYFGRCGFQGYGLPMEEHASDATIGKAVNAGLQQAGSRSTFGSQTDGPILTVLANEPSQGLSAMEELLNDLGYLGNVIESS
ncbi:MAG: hypothetical protein M1833_005506 [Piccolia ochrophora]|nr:MAG: hypothetical protein M1833_005506 [Piccolia ochrophora]